ncbi:hypothetical protein FRC17_010462 [Serendipita sp. 399]|nr:hypothetical protein FRC17_010462 [Serendipita sp. 399]
MSINWVELTQSNRPLPIDPERFLPSHTELVGASLKIIVPPPTSLSGSDAPVLKASELQASGTAYLSDMRLVFISNTPRETPGPVSFSTFSIAYPNILGLKYEQPWFGGNYIELVIRPVQDGGLATGSVVKCQLRVDGRGLYEFSAALAACMNAERNKRMEANTLREYLAIGPYIPRWILIATTAVYTPPANQNSRTAQTSIPDPNELPPGYSV